MLSVKSAVKNNCEDVNLVFTTVYKEFIWISVNMAQ